jgi:hypothetical protein
MSSIIVKHIIEEKKLTINFDLLAGSISFPTIDLNIEGDIDLNPLVLKLTELIEKRRNLESEFECADPDLEKNHKVQLIKETLIEMYSLFNKNLEDTDAIISENHSGDDFEDDLPF